MLPHASRPQSLLVGNRYRQVLDIAGRMQCQVSFFCRFVNRPSNLYFKTQLGRNGRTYGMFAMLWLGDVGLCAGCLVSCLGGNVAHHPALLRCLQGHHHQ